MSAEKTLSDINKQELQRISEKLKNKRIELQTVNEEIATNINKAMEMMMRIDQVKKYVSSFQLFAPTIEEYSNCVEADHTIEAGNSFRGILYELGKLLQAFKELIKDGLCWFPRLMRWRASKGDVAPVFLDDKAGYSYASMGHINVETREMYTKEEIQIEIKAYNRTGTVE